MSWCQKPAALAWYIKNRSKRTPLNVMQWGEVLLRALKSGEAMCGRHVSPAMHLAKALGIGSIVWGIDVSFWPYLAIIPPVVLKATMTSQPWAGEHPLSPPQAHRGLQRPDLPHQVDADGRRTCLGAKVRRQLLGIKKIGVKSPGAMLSNGTQGFLSALKSGDEMCGRHGSPAMPLAKALGMGTIVWGKDVSFWAYVAIIPSAVLKATMTS